MSLVLFCPLLYNVGCPLTYLSLTVSFSFSLFAYARDIRSCALAYLPVYNTVLRSQYFCGDGYPVDDCTVSASMARCVTLLMWQGLVGRVNRWCCGVKSVID
uniref:Uncharacterized protein n=1 Tax=Schistocephalus solidus TaxID=70667 RepID=A0A0V0J8Q8_SCHSO